MVDIARNFLGYVSGIKKKNEIDPRQPIWAIENSLVNW